MILLNLIGFLIRMIVCPILMIPYLFWRLLVNSSYRETPGKIEPLENMEAHYIELKEAA